MAHGTPSRLGNSTGTRPSQQGAIADLTALRGTDATGLASGIRRHLTVIACNALDCGPDSASICCSILSMFRWRGPESKSRHLEQGRNRAAQARCPPRRTGCGCPQATAVDAVILGQDTTAHDLALQPLKALPISLSLSASSMSVNSSARVALTPSLISWMRSRRGSSAMDRASSRSACAIRRYGCTGPRCTLGRAGIPWFLRGDPS